MVLAAITEDGRAFKWASDELTMDNAFKATWIEVWLRLVCFQTHSSYTLYLYLSRFKGLAIRVGL